MRVRNGPSWVEQAGLSVCVFGAICPAQGGGDTTRSREHNELTTNLSFFPIQDAVGTGQRIIGAIL